jgi:Site-specific recombinase XerD
MKNRLPEVITTKEFNQILKHTHKHKERLAFKLAGLAGLRISEVLNLKPEDIDLERGYIFIRSGKGKKDRYVVIQESFLKDLKHLPVDIPKRTLQRHFKNIAREAINKDIHFHTLRHSAATSWLDQGFNIREVQVMLGHSSLNTTAIYTHISMNEIKRKFEMIRR